MIIFMKRRTLLQTLFGAALAPFLRPFGVLAAKPKTITLAESIGQMHAGDVLDIPAGAYTDTASDGAIEFRIWNNHFYNNAESGIWLDSGEGSISVICDNVLHDNRIAP